MIKQTDKDKLKALGIDLDAIIKAHEATTETDIVVPEGELLTADQLTARDDVKLKEGKKAGEKEALTIAKTELGKHGFELKAERFGDLAKELNEKITATGDDKLKTLQEQNRLLLVDKTTLAQERDAAVNGLKTGMLELDIISKIPAGADISSKERFELAKMRGYQFEEVDGVMGIKKGGEFIRDKTTQSILGLDKAIPVLIEEQKWTPAAVTPTGGRGVTQKPLGAMTGAVPKNHTQAESTWAEMYPDKNINSAEGQAQYAEWAKQPDFNVHE